jgi:hypothetical protein
MFQATEEEFAALRSHFAASNAQSAGRGSRRYLPFVFTEHGAIMAATILNCPHVAEVLEYVVRAFVRLREVLASHRDLAQKLEELENKTELMSVQHDTFAHNARAQLKQMFEAIRELMTLPDAPKKRPIEFVTPEDASTKPKADRAEKQPLQRNRYCAGPKKSHCIRGVWRQWLL